MPPKKRKANSGAAGTKSTQNDTKFVWILSYKSEYQYVLETEVHSHAFSTAKKAMESMPALVDKHCAWEDWRCGLKGFGQEDRIGNTCFDYYGDTFGSKTQGVLLKSHVDGSEETITVSLERLMVDQPIVYKPRSRLDSNGDDETGGFYQSNLAY